MKSLNWKLIWRNKLSTILLQMWMVILILNRHLLWAWCNSHTLLALWLSWLVLPIHNRQTSILKCHQQQQKVQLYCISISTGTNRTSVRISCVSLRSKALVWNASRCLLKTTTMDWQTRVRASRVCSSLSLQDKLLATNLALVYRPNKTRFSLPRNCKPLMQHHRKKANGVLSPGVWARATMSATSLR